ncbi:MAG: N-acetylmuramoyl-L-alanine amidase, partial [Lachnospiraceae bacterium]|nr:N-acetylmuramoyl-L-alanine amidase [Candidatus Equihabitans merdae]
MEQAALEESKQAEAEAARSEEEAQAHQEDYENTQQALEEQTRQANIENSATLKKIAAISVPSLSAYLAAQQTPQVAGQGHIVCIDAGHEEVDLLEQEPNAPGSDVMKQKVSSGTYGEASGLEEYQLVLMVALKEQTILQNRGYQVVMTRTD